MKRTITLENINKCVNYIKQISVQTRFIESIAATCMPELEPKPWHLYNFSDFKRISNILNIKPIIIKRKYCSDEYIIDYQGIKIICLKDKGVGDR